MSRARASAIARPAQPRQPGKLLSFNLYVLTNRLRKFERAIDRRFCRIESLCIDSGIIAVESASGAAR